MKRILLILLLFVAAVSVIGCSFVENKSELSTQYTVDYATDASQYCLQLNKQINLVINELNTNVLIAKDVMNGDYPKEDAKATAEQSLSEIQSARKFVEVTNPPQQYADTRINVLRMFDNAENDLQTYIDNINGGVSNEIISIMRNDSVALTGEFNIYYE